MRATTGQAALIVALALTTILAALLAAPIARAHPGSGIDVHAQGEVYLAASGCSAVLKVTPHGALSVVLRSSDAWTPTGIAVHGEDVYVLEFRFIEVERSADWLPRVRKLSRDGAVATIAPLH